MMMNVRMMVLMAASLSMIGAAAMVPLEAREARIASEPVDRSFEIDHVHSTALFRVHHFGAGMFWGRFNDITGTIVLDDAGEPVSFEVNIDPASIDTNTANLDNHLKSPDFFNVREYPEMGFTSTAIEKVEGENLYTLKGTLTMHGVTKEISAELEHTGTSENARGARTGFEARFAVKRSEYEISYGLDNNALGDETKIIVALEAQRRAE